MKTERQKMGKWDKAWEKYQKALNLAREKYEKAKSSALDKYQLAQISAWQEYTKKLKELRSEEDKT